jgi:predicted  nucleic acid-binding Zn-ribbon protein
MTSHLDALSRRASRVRRVGRAGWLIAALALSCDRLDPGLSRRLEEAERERDRLREEVVSRRVENEAHEQYIAATTKELNEVQDSIDGVRRDLNVIHVSLGPSGELGGSRQSQGQAVLGDIANIRTAVQANLEKLAQVERRYRGSAAEVILLKSIVRKLQDHVAEQQRELAEMEERIRRLSEELANKDKEIHDDEEALEIKKREIEQIKEEARTGYVLVGSVAALRNLDLIEGQRSGLFGIRRRWRLKNAIDKRAFSPVDTAKVTDIPIAAPLGAIEILTPHPPSSYHLEHDGSGHAVLRITDSGRFWQFRYLVILIRP